MFKYLQVRYYFWTNNWAGCRLPCHVPYPIILLKNCIILIHIYYLYTKFSKFCPLLNSVPFESFLKYSRFKLGRSKMGRSKFSHSKLGRLKFSCSKFSCWIERLHDGKKLKGVCHEIFWVFFWHVWIDLGLYKNLWLFLIFSVEPLIL